MMTTVYKCLVGYLSIYIVNMYPYVVLWWMLFHAFYAVLAALHIFIGANRFGPGRKYLGKGWILLTYLSISKNSVHGIELCLFVSWVSHTIWHLCYNFWANN